MLDHFFYNIDFFVAGTGGSDRMVILIFTVAACLPVLIYAAFKVERVLKAGVLLFLLAILSYIPLSIADTALEKFYLSIGLFTETYVNQIPLLLRFPTLWVFSLVLITILYLLISLTTDILSGKPVLTRKIIDRRYDESKRVAQEWIEEMSRKNKNQNQEIG